MNLSLISLEIWVVALGLVLMLADFWMPAERRRFLGYAAAAALAVLLVMNLGHCATGTAFNGMFVHVGHFGVLLAHRLGPVGNVVCGICQQLRDAVRLH
jgi:NADH:ubiquinone oxidoreductase subunit 2 (subunit N)